MTVHCDRVLLYLLALRTHRKRRVSCQMALQSLAISATGTCHRIRSLIQSNAHQTIVMNATCRLPAFEDTHDFRVGDALPQ